MSDKSVECLSRIRSIELRPARASLDTGKKLVQALGERERVRFQVVRSWGIRGVLCQKGKMRSEAFILSAHHLAMISVEMLVGYYSFACAFRRPSCTAVADLGDIEGFRTGDPVLWELVSAKIFLPPAFTDLRAPARP